MSFLTGHRQMMTKKRLTEQVSRFLLSYFFFDIEPPFAQPVA